MASLCFSQERSLSKVAALFKLNSAEGKLVNIQEEIFRSIENIVKKQYSSTSADYPTVILGVEGNNKYKVKINGVDRIVKDGIGLNLGVGAQVWVHAMNGDIGKLYVLSRR